MRCRIAAVALVVLTTACGAAPQASRATEPTVPAAATATSSEPRLPVTVTGVDGVEVTVTAIDRIIPLDGDVAEIVFALGLGDRVVATDLSATYPSEADALPEVGYQRALSAEPIAAFEPTVLLATEIAGPPETFDELRRLGFPLVVVANPPTPMGPATKIRAVAGALGVPARGEAIADRVQAEIDSARTAATAHRRQPRVLALYIRGSNVQLVLGTDTAVNWLIEAAGGVDVAGELGVVETAQISAEAVVAAAPDVLLVAERGLESVDGVDGLLDIPGLAETPAGRARRVLAYDDQMLLGNGPRTGELLARLVEDLHEGATR